MFSVREQLYEIVTLVNELLPALPDGPGVGVGSSSSDGSGSRGGRKHQGLAIASKLEEGVGAAAGPVAREILLREQPELLEQFSNDLFPVLVQVGCFMVEGVSGQSACLFGGMSRGYGVIEW